MQKWNKEFDVEAIDSNCFYIVLVDDVCDDNFSDCVNNEGYLRYSSSNYVQVECSLKYDTNNGRESIVLDADAVIDFTDAGFRMKGIFLTTDTGYVMGYNINQTSVLVNTSMTFEKDFIFYDIVEGATYGE